MADDLRHGRSTDRTIIPGQHLRFGPVARQTQKLYRKLDLATSNIMMIKSVVAGNLNWNLLRNDGDSVAVEWDKFTQSPNAPWNYPDSTSRTC